MAVMSDSVITAQELFYLSGAYILGFLCYVMGRRSMLNKIAGRRWWE